MRKIKILLFVLVMISVVSGCSLLSSGFIFENESSYTIEVDPSGEDSFTLEPGESHKVDTADGYITFTYSPATSVLYEQNETGLMGATITFYDR